MRLLSVLLTSFAFALSVSAQTPPAPAKQDPALLTELNTQIWMPFHEAYRDGEAEKYIALHRPEFIRGEGTRKVVRTLDEYAAGVRRSFEIWKERGLKIDLQFRFIERIVKGAQASERGIYRFTLTPPDGKAQTFYGQFHTFSRKVDGRWQLIVDYDSNEGGTVDAAKYEAASAVDDFSRF
jgi:ketosteroid isomerase-like protein